ncbi:VQ motif containing protein [Quillaja saponaria]|uniref:VQ motif containing protein n=1 Tax=Quillaja saponaria TaxID=32244 RepID=A0AAD7M4I3_QUISA|nr:VQ motif containing protein [Quillaja saponaria]
MTISTSSLSLIIFYFFDSLLSLKHQKSESSMDSVASRYQENFNNPTFILCPNSRISHSSSSSSSSPNSNGLQRQRQRQQPPTPTPTPTPPSQTPRPITRSESSNPYPTTFIQADTSSFKQVVQMLTGSSETAKLASSKSNPTSELPSKTHIPPIKSMPKKQQSGFKLYERRNSLKNFKINPLIPVFASNNSGFSPRKPEILSPSILDFPSLVLSPVTPLIPDPFDRSAAAHYRCSDNNASPNLDREAEEKAIKEKGFFLHPSPTTTPRGSEPRLLPLFPTTSPRAPAPSST